MKKLLLIASALLAFTFFGCNQPGSPSAQTPAQSGAKELVLFDPATYDGEKVEIGGEVFAKITPDQYNTTINIDPPLDCSSVSKFKAKLCAPEANAGLNLTIKIADKDNADISSIPLYGLVTEPTSCEVGFSKKEEWNTVSETKLAAKVQPMVQESTEPYAAQSGVVVYVGKVTAE